jgi:hypothetical protein
LFCHTIAMAPLSSKGSQGEMVSPQGCHVSWEKRIMALCCCCTTLRPLIFKHEYLPGGIHIESSHYIQDSFEFLGLSGGNWQALRAAMLAGRSTSSVDGSTSATMDFPNAAMPQLLTLYFSMYSRNSAIGDSNSFMCSPLRFRPASHDTSLRQAPHRRSFATVEPNVSTTAPL